MGKDIARRDVFAAGIGLAALAGLSGIAKAAAVPDAAEAANTKLVEVFLASWSAKGFNPETEFPKYLAGDAVVRMEEDKPAVTGAAATAARFKTYMAHGETFSVKMLETYAKGPVVVTSRVDTMTIPGKPDQLFKVAGVFVVKAGKIKEWTDYLVA